MTSYLSYEGGKDAPPDQTNRRNGSSPKRLNGQTRIDGMDDKIIGLYATGLTVRDIRAHLEDVYGLQVSPGLISRGPMRCRMRFGSGNPGRWTGCLPSSFLSLYGSRSATPLLGHCFAMPCRAVDSRMVKNKPVYLARRNRVDC
ncbi:transposase [Tateyamaria sp.]|uniref:transposase n=1 Tax=Tateyamaria sp. TaxID=1929288 RepID=UPI0039B8A793